MPRPSRHLLSIVLVAAYGFAILCAPALHSLSTSTHKVSAPSGEDGPSLSTAHDDCPICHFHSQGQLVVASDRLECTDVVQIRPADVSPLHTPPAPSGPSAPRAPPVA